MRFMLLVFLLLAGWLTKAQPLPPGALKSGIGLTFYSPESQNTPTLLLAFAKDFFPRTAIEVSAEWALPVDYQLSMESGDLQSFRFGLSFLYKVLGHKDHLLQLGPGLSGGLYDRSSVIDFPGTSLFMEQTDLKFGFTLLVTYNYIFANEFFIGARAGTFRYDADQSGWQTGAVAGFRF